MPWLQLELETSPENVDAYSEWLAEAGAVAVTLIDAADQPLFEPAVGETPLWLATRVVGLFESHTEILEVIQYINSKRNQTDALKWHLNPLEDRDWVRAWMDDFKPMQFGQQLWICPGGFAPPDPDAINLRLDPGLAFGTGTHPTTAMCLTWLANHPPRSLEVTDYGCGSGILAIAACMLGASRVIAIDNDPQALTATRENAIKNDVIDKIEISLPEQCPQKPRPLLIANILATPLIELEHRLAEMVPLNGTILLSGILADQADMILETYRQHFEMKIEAQMEDWVCISGRKR